MLLFYYVLRSQGILERNSMAKIIKVGSQNPTFTSQKIKKASPLHTHRNSNEVTNPFKFTNFEGNTLQFADVFEGFKPSFKASSANKLRIVASSVTGSMSKMKSSVTESIANFARRVSDWASTKKTEFLATPIVKKTNDILFTKHYMSDIISNAKEGINSRIESISSSTVDLGNSIKARWAGLVKNVSSIGRSKYDNMSVPELRVCLAEALAQGGINE